MKPTFYIYILASKRKGTLYVGITNNLLRRVYEHKNNIIKGFSEKYKTHLLVYFESFTFVDSAIRREKQLKWWKRNWKIKLIESDNPEWKDLYHELK